MLMFGLTPIIFEELEKEFVKFFEDNKDNLDKCEFLLPDVLDEMIKGNKIRIKVLPTSAKWLGVTYKEDVDKVREQLKKLHDEVKYPQILWK